MMAVTKRTRYEVMRRDNFTCRYCRSSDQALTVDHVVPTALGGTDAPDNLVAACKDCNAGKSSSNPDGTLIEDVKQDALRHAEMIRQAYAVVVARMGERDEYLEEFWNNYGWEFPDDYDWRSSITRFFNMGVPIEIVADAAQIANRSNKQFYGDGRFKYVCGIIWNQVHALGEAVEAKASLEGSFMTPEQIDELESAGYATGRKTGERLGFKRAFDTFFAHDIYSRALSYVADGMDEESMVHRGWLPA